MARVMIADSQATELSNGSPLRYRMDFDDVWSTSQPIRLYTQLPRVEFDLEFLLRINNAGIGVFRYDIEWYLEYFNDSFMLNDPRARNEKFPTARLSPVTTGGEGVSWERETVEAPVVVPGERRIVRALRSTPLWSNESLHVECASRALWARVKYKRGLFVPSPAYQLVIWANLGGFVEEPYLETSDKPYAY